jgi:hypothetical protein
VIVVDGAATHSPKDGVESNRGSLEDGAEASMLFLRGAQLFENEGYNNVIGESRQTSFSQALKTLM